MTRESEMKVFLPSHPLVPSLLPNWIRNMPAWRQGSRRQSRPCRAHRRSSWGRAGCQSERCQPRWCAAENEQCHSDKSNIFCYLSASLVFGREAEEIARIGLVVQLELDEAGRVPLDRLRHLAIRVVQLHRAHHAIVLKYSLFDQFQIYDLTYSFSNWKSHFEK